MKFNYRLIISSIIYIGTLFIFVSYTLSPVLYFVFKVDVIFVVPSDILFLWSLTVVIWCISPLLYSTYNNIQSTSHFAKGKWHKEILTKEQFRNSVLRKEEYSILEIEKPYCFISYASQDRDFARVLADALRSNEIAVWWDRKIPVGQSFDQIIEAALESAECIIVLWSGASVNSDWVKSEAAEGAKHKILIPILIEDVNIPLGFRRLQTASLIDWDGDKEHEGVLKVIAAVKSFL